MAAIVPVQFGVSMSLTVIAVAVGDIARDLDTGTGAASWTVTGAILASAVSTSLGGKFGDIYGHRRAFLAAAVMLVVVTPLSGLAWSIESLIGFRVAAGVANGVANGVATAAGTAMVLLAFPISTRSRAIGWYQSALSGAPAIGLIVGGQIVEQFGWRWVFAFFGVIAVVGLVTSAAVVRPMGGGLEVSIDYWGGLTLSAGVALVLVGLTLLGNDGVGTSVSIVLMGGGVVLLAAFARIEQRVPEPIISMDYLRKRNFSIPIWVVTLANFSFMGGLVITPFLFTERLGWGLGAATLLLAVRPITFSSCAFAGGYIHPRLGARMTPVVGSSLLAVGMVFFALSAWQASLGWTVAGLFVVAIGHGIQLPSLTTTASDAVEPEDYGVASGMRGTLTQVGVTTGMQTMVIVIGTDITGNSLANSYLLGAAAAVLAVALSLAISPRPRY
ncbi:MFS transporter [Candidatus Poriferisocius sp.]|uniref:MFS transporter n=1 Tax=Candidatus Poriferisocius sp. TaxID=3101276 RepID=UPI003B020890